jgi:ABC-type lipoprotein export system ATPase subunit
MNSAIVLLEGVSKVFDGGRLQALKDISFEIFHEQWLTITGPSGCGKTTLLNLISGLDTPTSGTIFFQGVRPKSAVEWSRIRSRQIGFIFQAFHLLPRLTALENIQMPLFESMPRERDRYRKAMNLLERVGLAERANHLPGDLSGGERQRVAIARSLANTPSLIIADEPTGNLDSISSQQILDLLREVYQEEGTTIALVTHNPEVAREGNRWIKLRDGRIIEDHQTFPICDYSS